jgi:prepilin-type N-terminal cleavage/methylation domain-containing protein
MRSDGHSLIELLVVLAVMGVVALAAAQLVVESVSLFHAADRTVTSPSLTWTTAALRSDIQQSAGLPVVSAGWAQSPLELIGWDGGRVRFGLEGRSLVRESFDSMGRPTARRTLAGGVSAWRWRPVTPLVVEVSITVMAGRTGDSASPVGSERRTVTRRFAFRGWPNGRSW